MASDQEVVVRELRERSDAELRSLLDGKQDDLFQEKFKHALGQLRETHTLKRMKRDIARINTLIWERERQGASATGEAS